MILEQAVLVYEYVDSPRSNRRVVVYTPGELSSIEGILFIGNGADADATQEAFDSFNQAWADERKLMIVATGNFGRFQGGTSGGDWQALWRALTEFSLQNSFAQVANLPLYAWGFSNGGQMAYALARLLPETVKAFVVNKGGFYERDFGIDPVMIPGLFIAGEYDNERQRRDTIRKLFEEGNKVGAPWVYSEEKGLGHVLGNSKNMAFSFFDSLGYFQQSDFYSFQ